MSSANPVPVIAAETPASPSSARTGKDLILATKPFAREIRWRSWFAVCSTLVLMTGGLTAAALPLHWAIRLAASVFSGLIIIRMFIIYHDHQHSTILQESAIGNVLMKAFGVFVLAPASIWKRSHDFHHKHNSKLYTASIGSYPILTREKFLSATRAEQKAYLRTRSPLTIALGYYSMFLGGMCLRSFRSNPGNHWDSLLAIILHFVGYGALYLLGGWQTILFAWFIPFLIATAIGAYLFYVQHNFPEVTFKNKEEWTYHEAALESSSYMRMSKVMHFFTGNIGYHHIHHLNARIPFYRLPEAMRAIPELQKAKTTSWHPRDVIACLRLKVWDPDKGRMTGIPGA
ncbi:MAG: fatty acid desaturase [Bacteroidetes bacterium]|nr:fatty acid desaturase [Bacteroidota bacterium]